MEAVGRWGVAKFPHLDHIDLSIAISLARDFLLLDLNKFPRKIIFGDFLLRSTIFLFNTILAVIPRYPILINERHRISIKPPLTLPLILHHHPDPR